MKVKVLKPFRDVHTKALLEAGTEVVMSEKRFAEAQASLEAFGGGFLEPTPEALADSSENEAPEKSIVDMPPKNTRRKKE